MFRKGTICCSNFFLNIFHFIKAYSDKYMLLYLFTYELRLKLEMEFHEFAIAGAWDCFRLLITIPISLS